MVDEGVIRVSELAIYPLKSARQVRVSEMTLGALGPAWDRRWMLVDTDGRFVTQRTHARLCLLSATVGHDALMRLAAPGMSALLVQPVVDPERLAVTVWNDTVLAEAVSPEADAWCSAFLGMPVRLAFMPEATQRIVSPAVAGPGQRTGFSDGFPLLLVTQASLDHLNAQLESPVDWRRFRPNIVLAGAMPPHAEDDWRRLRIGAVELEIVKSCSRCVIPSIDPDTGVKNGQILTILRSYRARADRKTYFGQNVIVKKRPEMACLRVGDLVSVLE